MEPFSLKTKNFLIFQERICKAPKANKKSTPKKFLLSCDVFVIFILYSSKA